MTKAIISAQVTEFIDTAEPPFCPKCGRDKGLVWCPYEIEYMCLDCVSVWAEDETDDSTDKR